MGGGIDLAAVRLATLNRDRRIRVTFRLHRPAFEVSLGKPGGMSVSFVRDRRNSRVVEVMTEDGLLRSEVCTHSMDGQGTEPYDCSPLPFTRVDAQTYRTVVELEQVEKGAKVLHWSAASMDLLSGMPVSDWLTAKDRKPFRWRL